MIFYGQGVLTSCNSFDTLIVDINIDSSGIWRIGEPSKTVFDSSYSGTNSIVTNLNSLYPTNDTSTFYAVLQSSTGIPNYLGLYNPLEIEFDHRFITDGTSDYGSIEMSFDFGVTWFDVLSSEHNISMDYNGDQTKNEHYFEGTGNTVFDSLVVSGNSNGWVHSKFAKDIANNVTSNVIVIMLKFSFITDSLGRNEGWQIDNLCMSIKPVIIGIMETQITEHFSIYPNPNKGKFSIPENIIFDKLKIFNVLGAEVFSSIKNEHIITASLRPGIYIVVLYQNDRKFVARMVVN